MSCLGCAFSRNFDGETSRHRARRQGTPEALQACEAADLRLVSVEHSACVGAQLVQAAAASTGISVRLESCDGCMLSNILAGHCTV